MLTSNTLYIHVYNLDNLPQAPDYPLTEYELARLQSLPVDKQAFYRLKRNIIRETLRYHKINPELLSFTKSGQPLINKPFAISMSHSKTDWLIALMQCDNLGIDIQIPTPKNLATILQHCQLPRNTTSKDFLKHWMLCESYCKCTQSPLLSTLKLPIEKHLIHQNLHSIITTSSLEFAAVSTSPIQNLQLIDKKIS